MRCIEEMDSAEGNYNEIIGQTQEDPVDKAFMLSFNIFGLCERSVSIASIPGALKALADEGNENMHASSPIITT